MAAELKTVQQASGTVFGISGTQFLQNNTYALTLLCGVSGLAIIPIRVDATGAIENTT